MKLVLLRHGQSIWNQQNKFTGWTDVALTEKGRNEAKQAGILLNKNDFHFDMAYTSFLKRAIKTLWTVLEEMDLMWIPVEKSWRLNERHYGALQGFKKKEMAEKVGEEQVNNWRRSYSQRPPLLPTSDKRNPNVEPKYLQLSPLEIPLGESLEDTVHRLESYWEEHIWQQVQHEKSVLVVAHGNSLRAIIKYLEHATNEEIAKVEIPTGIPLVYEFAGDFKNFKKYYLN